MELNNIKKEEATIADIFEVVVFIKDNAVTKQEFNESRQEFNDKMNAFDSRLIKVEATMVTKDYLDDKLADLGSEIGARINRLMEKERLFKQEIIDVLKRHSLADEQEITKLESFI